MKVSVITVTYNDLPGLRRTVKSVLRQDYGNWEYIVVDGASNDGTRSYLETESRGQIKWISEPDGGIYEAMNKGTGMASGDYCIFINAGDCFVNSHVLSSILPYLDGSDLVTGNLVYVDERGRVNGYVPSKGCFTFENLFQSAIPHQASFIRRDVLLAHPYDESLRLVSDWKFFLELRLTPTVTFRDADIDICFFRAGGATARNRELGARERQSVLSGYPEYKHIWDSPYKPSFLQKAYRKLLYYRIKVFYSLSRDKDYENR